MSSSSLGFSKLRSYAGLAFLIAIYSPIASAAKPVNLLRPRGVQGVHATSQPAIRHPVTETHRRRLQQQQSNQFNACPLTDYVYSGPTPDSIFDELSIDEYTSVIEYVAQELDFVIPASGYSTAANSSAAGSLSAGAGASNLTDVASANDTDAAAEPTEPEINYNVTAYENYIYNVFSFPVNKAEALQYLDSAGPLPARYAKVIAVRGGYDPPDVMEYKVGPLPLQENATIEQLYGDGDIPFVKRPSNDLPEAVALGEWSGAVLDALKDLFFDFIDQCGGVDDPDCDANNITAFNVVPPTRENGKNRIVTILHFLSIGDGSSYELHNLPFAYKINVTDQDYNVWEAFEFEFCGQGFADLDDLLADYGNGTVRICRPETWLERNYSTAWSLLGEQGPVRMEGLQKPGPRVYEPAGKRFSILQGDSETSRVFQWAGWQGHVTTNPWTGLSFRDIRFMGKRILFELSLNDQMVVYSGYSSIGQTFYLDSFDQIGASQYTLRPGYDCPETATYMPVNLMGPYGQQFSFNESVCFFEMADQATSWRHFDTFADGTSDAQGIRQYEFVVRTVATLGNYDYIVTVFFQLDGSIRCRVDMAGYLQAIYYDTDFGFSEPDLAYGTRVQTHTIGNLHDHLSSWKVDLDVGGTNNSFHTTTVRVGTYEDVLGPGSTPPWALPTDVMKYQDDQLVEEESGYVLDYKEPTIFNFINPDLRNAWGQPKGYGIFHGGTTTQLLPHSHPILQAAAWSKYHIAVTQRKENEETSSKDYYDTHSPGDVPLISNLGTEFSLKPLNYFDHLPSMDIVDTDNFEACAAAEGDSLFDYKYSIDGHNKMGDKAGFKYSGPLSSSNDAFQPTARPDPALQQRAVAPLEAPSGSVQPASAG